MILLKYQRLEDLSQFFYKLFVKWHMQENIAELINMFILILVTLLLITLSQYVLRRVLRLIVIQTIRKTNNEFFKGLLESKVPYFLSLTAPLFVIDIALPLIFKEQPAVIKFCNALVEIYTVLVFVWIMIALIRAGASALKSLPSYKTKPIEGYLQVIRIGLYLAGMIYLFSNLTGKSPAVFFTTMGAISAILLLMFRDVIMGFVASIQVNTNDIVRIGDWITMPKYGADGDILEINLTTVKVQNFDKTITTIPTYALISDSFQNWRGMRQAGGRRIKRAVHIKQSSIRFIKPHELENFSRIQLLTSYIEHRQKDIEKHNARVNADKSLPINGRNLTNAGLFRKYIDNYISSHTGTHKRMSMMVRQLAPTEHGLPIEIYVFTNTIVWTEYEYIMADIFDHIIAAAPYFDLQVFELEAAGDVKRIEMYT
ncbi:mechanosensitive ion channel family protein [Pedobacter sp.]|uniref:mechanosensitive ion channel family protein n=1 Tax=Pedobacter sp. TaxID=1411316 RepID=UPI00396C44F7